MTGRTSMFRSRSRNFLGEADSLAEILGTAAGPSRIATATARFNSTIGDGAAASTLLSTPAAKENGARLIMFTQP